MSQAKQTKQTKEEKAARRRAKARKRRVAQDPAAPNSENGFSEEKLESRLARIQDALADQTKQSTELLARVSAASKVRAGSNAKQAEPSVERRAVAGLDRALELRRDNVFPVDEPLALICQAQRSGGTLLGRLFDGHPQCHVHPHELLFGGRIPHNWPRIDLDDEARGVVRDAPGGEGRRPLRQGQAADPAEDPRASVPRAAIPCMLPPQFQRLIFLDEVERRSPITSGGRSSTPT